MKNTEKRIDITKNFESYSLSEVIGNLQMLLIKEGDCRVSVELKSEPFDSDDYPAIFLNK